MNHPGMSNQISCKFNWGLHSRWTNTDETWQSWGRWGCAWRGDNLGL